MIIDECHMGSSLGTSEKTKKFYKIKNVYDWGIEDESYMKRLINSEIDDDNKKL